LFFFVVSVFFLSEGGQNDFEPFRKKTPLSSRDELTSSLVTRHL